MAQYSELSRFIRAEKTIQIKAHFHLHFHFLRQKTIPVNLTLSLLKKYSLSTKRVSPFKLSIW